ncbi:MAG: response regulator [Gammaproteobacteria bacterium]|nr:response regulator [Gammaproteobacteria bacterium]
MEDSNYELPEQLILARQANLLRTFYKLVAVLTGVALLLIAFLPGFATSEDVVEPFVRNVFVILTIGFLYWLLEKEYILASIFGTIGMTGFFAVYSVYMESPGNMQMMTLVIFPTCVAGLLPRRNLFWLVYIFNMLLMLFTVWLIITYRDVDMEYRSVITIGLLLTMIALLIDVLSSSYRASLTTTFNQLVELRTTKEKLTQLDADLEAAVTERIHAETVSSQLAQTGRLAMEAAGAGSILIDMQSDSVKLTEEFIQRYGFVETPADSKSLCECIHADDRKRFETLINQDHSTHDRCEGDFRIKADSPIYWMFILETEGENKLQGIIVDVTYRVLEHQRQFAEDSKAHESQRLESLGILAGAIAHDFNNLLHVIMLNADLARKSLNPDSKSAISINRLMTTVDRAAELCSELLAYSGKGHFIIEPFHAETLVKEMRSLLDISTPKGVAIEVSTDSSNPTINGDITQIRQIVMNLVTNAGEAIGNRSDGRIRLSVETQNYDAMYLRQNNFIEEVAAGKFACIIVEDNGIGMNGSTQKRMFDPFYSTKDTGHGLGLSAVLGIVRGHHGTIKVDSSPDNGTRITMLFPLGDASTLASPEEPVTKKGEAAQGLILFVDDESEIRALAQAVLHDAGFSIIEARDGQEAIEKFRDHHTNLRLVILDLMMPNKTGLEAYLEIIDIDPSVPVIFSSGFNESELLNQLPPTARAAFIKKPYLADDLRDFVQNIIGPKV